MLTSGFPVGACNYISNLTSRPRHSQAARLLQSLQPVAQPRAIEWIAVGAIFWVVAAGLQWKAGAFAVEFGGNADESAHYITGLMIRDYIVSIVSGHLTSPLAYAENYYVHYPKVSIGMWPPLFHLTEAFWGLIVSPGRVSILCLMALITASIATSIYLLLRRQYPMVWAFAGGALFVISPLVQASTQAVMADGLVALLDFWAMIFLIRYLERERSRDAMLFGIFVGLSMATKANGVALVLLPLVAMLITRRFQLLRSRWFYYSGAIVLVARRSLASVVLLLDLSRARRATGAAGLQIPYGSPLRVGFVGSCGMGLCAVFPAGAGDFLASALARATRYDSRLRTARCC